MDQKILFENDTLLKRFAEQLTILTQKLPPNTAEIVRVYDYLLRWSFLVEFSATECTQLVQLFAEHVVKLLVKGQHFAKLRSTRKTLSDVLQIQGTAGQAALDNLLVIQLSFLSSLDAHSVDLSKRIKNPLPMNEVAFNMVCMELENVLNTSCNITTAEGLKIYFKALERAIDVQLLGYEGSNIQQQYSHIKEALSLCVEGLGVAEQKDDGYHKQRFALSMDICFAHAWSWRIKDVSFSTTTNFNRLTLFQRALIAGDALLHHAQQLATDSDTPDASLLDLLEKSQIIYESITENANRQDRMTSVVNIVQQACHQLINIVTCLQDPQRLRSTLMQMHLSAMQGLMPWREKREELKQLRLSLATELKSLKLGDSLKPIQNFNRALREFIGSLLTQADEWFGKPLSFAYELIGFGSLARAEACPYSDLECGLLVDAEGLTKSNKILTECMLQIFQMQMVALGENGCARHPTWPVGLRLDDMYHPLMLNHASPTMTLWGEPKTILSYIQAKNLAQDIFFINILSQPCLLSKAPKGLYLFFLYQEIIKSKIHGEQFGGEPSMSEAMAEALRHTNQSLLKPFAQDILEITSIKDTLVRPLMLLLQVLALQHDIWGGISNVSRLEKLRDKGVIQPIIAEIIGLYLAYVLRVRCLAQLHYQSEAVCDEQGNERLDLSSTAKLLPNSPFALLNQADYQALQQFRRALIPLLCQAFSEPTLLQKPISAYPSLMPLLQWLWENDLHLNQKSYPLLFTAQHAIWQNLPGRKSSTKVENQIQVLLEKLLYEVAEQWGTSLGDVAVCILGLTHPFDDCPYEAMQVLILFDLEQDEKSIYLNQLGCLIELLFFYLEENQLVSRPLQSTQN
jgi:hypothetical protein